jgi:lactate permease
MVSEFILMILALLPFVMLFALIVLKKMPALKALPITFLVTVLIAVFVWKVSFVNLSASFMKGFFTAVEIILIIFGAVFLIEVLKQKKQIKALKNLLSRISPDARIQAIVIALFFGSLIEGISGFGVPAAITAPILVSIGFAPVLAVVLSLIANSTAVSFGAAGTPVLLGLAPLNLSAEVLKEITVNTALLHVIAGIMVPIALSYFVILHSDVKEKFSNLVKTLPFIIFAWVCFAVPYYLTAVYIGPELPSIVAGLFGLIVVSVCARFGFLVPKKTIHFWKVEKEIEKISFGKTMKSIMPYLIIILLLGFTRIFPLVKEKLSSFDLFWNGIFGTSVSYSFLPFYTPSFYFIISVLICLIFYKASKEDFKVTLTNALNRIKWPFVALVFAVALVQLFIISSNNASGLPGIPLMLGQGIASIAKGAYVFVSPFIGAFGSFIAGSNTVSNLLFGVLQSEVAKTLGISVALVLALQVVGGAVGNMIAVHNVIAVNSVVGLKNSEGRVIRKTIWVSIIYALVVGIVGFVLSRVL